METWIKAVLFVGGGAVLLIVILVPLGFHGVEYYEYAFARSTTTRKTDTSKVYAIGHHNVGITKEFKKFQADAHLIKLQGVEVFTSNRLAYGFPRSKTTRTVDTSKVYTSGHHYVGLTREFKVFPADAHLIELDDVAVFTSNRLEVNLDCSFQYFLRRDDLKLLHDTYDLQYQEILQNNAIDALKGATKDFSTQDFGRNRSAIEEAMFTAVKLRLGGQCCKKNCEDSSEGCELDCIEYSTCTAEDKGLFADVRYFQMGSVNIPENVRENNLLNLVQLEDGERSVHLGAAQLIRIETEQIVAEIENEAEELLQNATARSALILSRAAAESRAAVEQAHNRGLSKIFSDLNITSQDQKASLNYIRTLRDHQNVFLGVNFDSLAIRVYGNSGGGG